MKLFRYLAALAPLTLGVALSGCGGLLGAVNGGAPATLPAGPSRLTPAPTVITVPSTFNVTGLCTGVTAARVVFIKPPATAGGAATLTQVTQVQPATIVGNTYTITVNPTAAERFNSGGLWAVETTENPGAVINLIAFVPPVNAGDTVVAADCSTAQTVATGLLLQQVTPSFTITRELATVISGLGAGGSAFTFNRTGLNTGVQLLGGVVTQNLASQISALTFAAGPAKQLFTGESEILTVTATVNGVSGVAVPVSFANSNPAVLQMIVIGGNQVFVKSLGAGPSTITATAGTKSAIFVITGLGLHPQGHAQGGGSGI